MTFITNIISILSDWVISLGLLAAGGFVVFRLWKNVSSNRSFVNIALFVVISLSYFAFVILGLIGIVLELRN